MPHAPLSITDIEMNFERNIVNEIASIHEGGPRYDSQVTPESRSLEHLIFSFEQILTHSEKGLTESAGPHVLPRSKFSMKSKKRPLQRRQT